MKIEKLTENKIRVILNLNDFAKEHTDIHAIMTKPVESQSFFLDILLKAEKELNFHTDGCRLLIEAFSSEEDVLVLTITKYAHSKEKQNLENSLKNKVLVKRKTIDYSSKNVIYSFENFEEFCRFCKYVNKVFNLDLKKVAKSFSLYDYNSTYYFIIQNINNNMKLVKKFHLIATEFGKPSLYSEGFINKLLEHGKPIMKKNAIKTCVKYFN